jgi:hypothetical protein
LKRIALPGYPGNISYALVIPAQGEAGIRSTVVKDETRSYCEPGARNKPKRYPSNIAKIFAQAPHLSIALQQSVANRRVFPTLSEF